MRIRKGSILLDLTLSENELFRGLHKRIRKAIRKAERYGITNEVSQEYNSAYRIYADAAALLYLTPEPQDKVFNNLTLFVAKKNNKIIAMYTVRFEKDTSKEIYAGINPDYRDTQANSLLKWYIILYSKQNGYKYYDLGGFDPASRDPKIMNINDYKLRWGGKPIFYDINVDLFEYILYHLRQFRAVRLIKYIYDRVFK